MLSRSLQFILVLMLLASSSAFGRNLADIEFGTYLGSDLQILRSKERLGIEQVLKRRDEFGKSRQQIPRFGYTKDDIWAKVELVNPGAEAKTVYLEFAGPIEELAAYVVAGGAVVQTAKAGMFLREKSEANSIRDSHPIVKLSLPPGEATVFLGETAVAPHYPVILHDAESLAKQQAAGNRRSFFLLGISGTFFIMLLIICIFVNRTCSLLLLAAFASYFQLIGFVTGLYRAIASPVVESAVLWIYRYWPGWCGLYFLSLSCFAIFYFGRSRFFANRASKILTSVSLASQVLLVLVSPFDTVLAMNLFSVGFNIILFQAIYFSVQSARDGKREDVILAAGWMTFSFFTTMQLFYYLGVFDIDFFAVGGTIIGFYTLIALATITLVLGNRINLMKALAEKRDALVDLERNFGELRKREEIIRIFSNPLISVELSLGKNPLEYTPRYLESAVVFFDMRGFTALSENHNLLDVYKIVNLYAENIIEGVHTHSGFVDKMIGDAVMARFKNSDDCMQAVAGIRVALLNLNRRRVTDGTFPVKFGTGISYGKVLSANFGSTIKLDRTIIGDIVNISSRVESLTKVFKVDVLYDESFRASLAGKVEHTRFVGASTLAGKRQVTDLYEYFGHNLASVRELKEAHAPIIEAAWGLARAGSAADALATLDEAIRRCPPHTTKPDELMDETIRSVRDLITSQFRIQKAA